MNKLGVIVGTGILLALTACGGGETGTGAVDTGGGTGKDLAIGAITGFGSVFVNGIEFDTTDSAITLEGGAIVQNDLRIGMIVQVNGTINADGKTGVAGSITAEEELKGEIEAVTNGSALTVLGQTVQIDPNTRFENFAALTELASGMNVHVSGYQKQDSVIVATRVELTAAENGQKVMGTLRNLNTLAQTFDLGALQVDYSGIDRSSIADGLLSDGAAVKVSGVRTAAGQPLLAEKIVAAQASLPDAEEFELQGYVSNLVSSTVFAVNNIPVHTSATTRFEGGTAADIANGVKLEVSGALLAGVLEATSIEFSEGVQLKSAVATVDANAGSFTLQGMAGLTVHVNGNTALSGITQLAELQVGNYVDLRATLIGEQSLLASKLQVEADGSEALLQGPVTALGDSVLSILGLQINVAGWDDGSFSAPDGEGRAAFFSGVKVGALVAAQGLLDTGGIIWESVELQ